jgi:hypothetical protein
MKADSIRIRLDEEFEAGVRAVRSETATGPITEPIDFVVFECIVGTSAMREVFTLPVALRVFVAKSPGGSIAHRWHTTFDGSRPSPSTRMQVGRYRSRT